MCVSMLGFVHGSVLSLSLFLSSHLGYLSHIFNGQCTMSSLLTQSSFRGPGLLLACISGRAGANVDSAAAAVCTDENFVHRASRSLLVPFYKPDPPSWKALRSWDFQSASYALQSMPHPPRTGLFRAAAK